MLGVELTTFFILSQIFALFVIVFDVLSFQFKDRKKVIVCFAFAATFNAIHFLLLAKILTAVLVSFSILRFIVSYFTTDKKFMYLFLFLNTITSILLFSEIFDVVIFIGLSLIIIGVFQKNDKNMRLIMMAGTSFVIFYNILIFTPVGILVESIFLVSNIVGFYRYYLRN